MATVQDSDAFNKTYSTVALRNDTLSSKREINALLILSTTSSSVVMVMCLFLIFAPISHIQEVHFQVHYGCIMVVHTCMHVVGVNLIHVFERLERKVQPMLSFQLSIYGAFDSHTGYRKMASKGRESLNCPLCFEVYVDATLLGCGHTFCRKCLTEYDESRGAEAASMRCPVCRQDTVMGDGRVADLRANVTVNNLVEEFNKNRKPLDSAGQQPPKCSPCQKKVQKGHEVENKTGLADKFCKECKTFFCTSCTSKHNELFSEHAVVSTKDLAGEEWRASILDMCYEHGTEQRDFFCRTCRMFICNKCAIVKHRGTAHVVDERHVYETEKIDDKVKCCDIEKENVNMQNPKAEQKREETNATFDALQGSIDDVFTGIQERIEQRRQQIKEEVKSVQQRCNEKIDGIVAAGSKLSARVTSSAGRLARRRRGGLEGGSLSSHDHCFLEVDELITTCQDWRAGTVNSFNEVKKVAERVRFKRRNVDLHIGDVVLKWEVVKEFTLPGDVMNGLAVSSPESVLIACQTAPYVLKMTLNGDLSTFCSIGSESARDVTVLNTGTVLVSHCSGVKQFGESGVYNSTKGIFDVTESRSSKKIESDRDDNVYVSCWDEKVIHVFKPTGGKPQRSLKVRGTPQQVHTTRCGRIVVQTPGGVVVLEASGEEVTTITKPGCVLYPAVDQDDNLYIACVKHDQGIVSLEKYTLDGKHVQCIIRNMKIKGKEIKWYYMKCPSRDCIVFCTAGAMYVINKVLV